MGQMKDILYKALKSIFYNIHQPVIITSSLVIAITGRPERNNAFIWLQQIHKFILNEMAIFCLAKSNELRALTCSSILFHKISVSLMLGSRNLILSDWNPVSHLLFKAVKTP